MRSRSFWLLSLVSAGAACSGDSTSPASGTDTDGRLQIIPGVAALAGIDVQLEPVDRNDVVVGLAELADDQRGRGHSRLSVAVPGLWIWVAWAIARPRT